MNLDHFKTQDGIELYIDKDSGESFASRAGYARMAGVSENTVKKRINQVKDKGKSMTLNSYQTLANSASEMGYLNTKDIVLIDKIPTDRGVRTGTLITEEKIVEWLEKDNPSILKKISKLGVRATLHQWAGFEVKTVSPNNKPQLPQSYDEAILELAEQIKQRKKLTKEVMELNYHLGNIKQTVKDNLEAFDEVFDESKSVEENLSKFTEVTELYFKELARLDHILHSCANRDTVNHFIFINEGILDKNDRRAFGRLVKITCERLGIKYDAQTRKKDGQDLNCNHYPVTVLQTLLDLFGRGQNYAQIVDIYARLLESK